VTVEYCLPDLVRSLSQIGFNQLGFADDTTFGTFLQGTLIPAAQRVIDRYVAHNFQNNSGTVLLDGNGKDVLLIPPPYLPVLDVDSVKVDGASVSRIKYYDTYIAYDGGRFTENNSNHKNVEVVLDYGYSSVPEDVALVCAQLTSNMLADMLRRRLMPDVVAGAMQSNSETVIISGIGKSIQVFTPELRDVLDMYRYSHMDVT
jgi:hypothetical protein